MYGNYENGHANPKPKSDILSRMTMTFFLTNFPHKVTNKDLWSRCLKLGTVTDVFISSRLSKAGKRFGFIRFIKVNNVDKLLTDLRAVWFGNHRMYADVEKYGRKFQTKEKEASKIQKPVVANENVSVNKSFAEALSGVSGKSSSPSCNARVVKLNGSIAGSNEDTRSLLLKHTEPQNITLSRKWFVDEGFVDIEVHYIGGRWIYLSFANVNAKDSFMSNEKLKSRFIAIKNPCSNFVPDERIVWVEISGVPRGAWCEENFHSILGAWGKGTFYLTDWSSSFSMGKVCILTQSAKFIHEELCIEFGDSKFEIWLREFATWEPKIDRDNSDYSSSIESKNGYDSDCSQESYESGESSQKNSEEFDAKLCKENSLDSNEEGDHGGVTSDKKEVKHDCPEPVVSEDIFSLNRIIAEDAASRKRAKSCPPVE